MSNSANRKLFVDLIRQSPDYADFPRDPECKDAREHYEYRHGSSADKINGRFSLSDGTFPKGWIANEETDLSVLLYDSFLPDPAIELTDQFAALLNRTAFYNFSFAPKGIGSETIPFIVEAVLSYGISKFLDHLWSQLKSKQAHDLAVAIARDWNGTDSNFEIRLTLQEKECKVHIKIEQFPEVINDIDASHFKEIQKALNNLKSEDAYFIYDPDGKKMVTSEKHTHFMGYG